MVDDAKIRIKIEAPLTWSGWRVGAVTTRKVLSPQESHEDQNYWGGRYLYQEFHCGFLQWVIGGLCQTIPGRGSGLRLKLVDQPVKENFRTLVPGWQRNRTGVPGLAVLPFRFTFLRQVVEARKCRLTNMPEMRVGQRNCAAGLRGMYKIIETDDYCRAVVIRDRV